MQATGRMCVRTVNEPHLPETRQAKHVMQSCPLRRTCLNQYHLSFISCAVCVCGWVLCFVMYHSSAVLCVCVWGGGCCVLCACVRLHMCAYVLCVCVCVCVRLHMCCGCTSAYVSAYVLCVCVCLCSHICTPACTCMYVG